MRPLALLTVMAAPLAWAEEPAPAPGGGAPSAEVSAAAAPDGGMAETSNFFLESTLVGTVQRTGGILDLRLRYRRGMYASDSEAFHDNYFGAGIIEQATPIFSQTGAYVEVAPASFFRLTAAYELVGYFGAFNTLRTVSDCAGVQSMSADDPRCAFPLESHAKGIADYGHRLWAEALFQGHLGRFVIADNFSVERWFFRDNWAAGPGEDHWVNEMFNLPQKKQDLVLTNDASVLFEVLTDKPHLMVGVDSNLAYAAGTDYRTHRVGAMGVVHIPEWRGLRDLAAVLLVQFYTHDRYTRGPIPFVGLVLTCSTPNFIRGAQ